MNFDDAAKGNPSPARAGGVLRDENGSIIHILSKNLGETTNNYAEFTALEQGLRLLVQLGKRKAIVEGDSQVAITTVKKIQHGTQPAKAIKHWRLAAVTERIAQHLPSLSGIILQSMRRQANSLADHIANYAVDNPTLAWDTCWQELMDDKLRDQCSAISKKDLNEDDSVGRTEGQSSSENQA